MTAPADVDEPGADPGSERRRRLRTLTGILPVVGILVVLIAAALLVSPALRHTVSESFTRSDEHYVELFLTDERTARACPLTPDGDVAVHAAVTSHLAGSRDLGWTMRVTPAAGTPGTTTQQTSGTLATTPGRTTHFTATRPAPSGPYTVLVTLSGRSERLVLHC